VPDSEEACHGFNRKNEKGDKNRKQQKDTPYFKGEKLSAAPFK